MNPENSICSHSIEISGSGNLAPIWSFSRYSTFRRCRRAFAFRYCAAATPEISRLKKTVGTRLWLNSIFRDSMLDCLRFAQDKSPEEKLRMVESETARRFHSGWSRSAISAKEQENGLLLAEVLNCSDPESLDRLFNETKNRIKGISARLKESPAVLELLRTPYLRVKDFKSPDSFEITGIRVLVAPDLICEDSAGRLNIVNFQFGSIEEALDWDIRNGVYVLYGMAKFRMPSERISALTIFISDAASPPLPVAASRNPGEIREMIISQAQEMLEFKKNNPSPGGFPYMQEPKCISCEFSSLCRKNPQPEAAQI